MLIRPASPPPVKSKLSVVVKVTVSGAPVVKPATTATCQWSSTARTAPRRPGPGRNVVDAVERQHVPPIAGRVVVGVGEIVKVRNAAGALRHGQRVGRPERQAGADAPVGRDLQRVVAAVAAVGAQVDRAVADHRPQEVVGQRARRAGRIGVGRIEARARRNRVDVQVVAQVQIAIADVRHAERRRAAQVLLHLERVGVGGLRLVVVERDRTDRRIERGRAGEVGDPSVEERRDARSTARIPERCGPDRTTRAADPEGR